MANLLFVQKRSLRAGAQTSLARLVKNEALKELSPAILLGTDGWLKTYLEKEAVPVAKMAFPSPRSFINRIAGLRLFGRKVHNILTINGIYPFAVIANDHQECPLALSISRQSAMAPVITILRTSAMTHRDFQKYRCGESQLILCVGKELSRKVTSWTGKSAVLFQEGFCDHEFRAPRPWPDVFPVRVLVIGSEAPGKGFMDVIHALDLIEKSHPEFPTLQVDFTGNTPTEQALELTRKRRHEFRFLGRVDAFAELVENYSLAIHPSRAETFGMAPLEALIAGVPTLVSSTGVIDQLPLPPAWVFPPRTPSAIASRLVALWQQWPNHRFDLSNLQTFIHKSYHIDRSSRVIIDALAQIGAIPPAHE